MKCLKYKALIVVFVAISGFVKADEGMWLISNLDSTLVHKMKNIGLQLTSEQLYNDRQPSVKDAVMIFDNGCTGELVSANGLLFTNHHCGRDRVQQVSSEAHNYIRDGFWAASVKEEIPIKGLTVKFLIKMEDVTSRAVELLKTKSLRKVQSEIEKQYADSVHHYTASLDGLSNGQYYISVYQVFNDIRLVGNPPESIGNFGGETDNFEWPRQSADFSIFRVYADNNNLPALYSADNKPYHPKTFLPISLAGIHERFSNAADFTFIVVGAIDEAKIKPLIETYLGSLPATTAREKAKDLGIRPPKGKVEKAFYKGTDPKSGVNLVFTGAVKYNAQDEYLLKSLNDVLTIKLMEDLREAKSGVYGVRANSSFSKDPYESYKEQISFQCAPENVEGLIAAALKVIDQVKKNGVAVADLNKVKKTQEHERSRLPQIQSELC